MRVLLFSYAEKKYVVDSAGLLSSAERVALEQFLKSASDGCGADIVALIVNEITYRGEPFDYDDLIDSYDDALTEYADDYYDYNGYSDDGVLLLVDMGGRGWATSTKGKAINALTDEILYDIEDSFVAYLSNGNFYAAVSSFANDCSRYINYYDANGDAYHGGYSYPDYSSYTERDRSLGAFFLSPVRILIPLVVSLLFALIKLGIEKRKLTSVRPVNNASAYLIENSFELIDNSDVFLRSDVSKTRRDTDSGSRSGGGGSSTHTSSSGSSHGGHSGRF
ncbi:MAG: TPM domain-containing protein [Clostridia bacterium]|nr:TPM domain-containing protein [Clostridia bacterium]